jgi:hypothetical protein
MVSRRSLLFRGLSRCTKRIRIRLSKSQRRNAQERRHDLLQAKKHSESLRALVLHSFLEHKTDVIRLFSIDNSIKK